MGHCGSCFIFRLRSLPRRSYIRSIHDEIRLIGQLIELFRYNLVIHHEWDGDTCTITLAGFTTEEFPIAMTYEFSQRNPLIPQLTEFRARTNALMASLQCDSPSDSD